MPGKKAVRKAAKPAKGPARKAPKKASKKASKKAAPKPSQKGSASDLITARIRELGGWRGETLAHMRKLIREADPAIVEEWKWDVPVWSRDGIVCTGESYREHVKLTFAKGAFVPDPRRLFNSSLTGNLRRAIDVREGEKIDATAFRDLVREAVALNQAHAAKKSRS